MKTGTPFEDTLWGLDLHTSAKHGILRGYLQAWMPIMSRQVAARRKQDAVVRYIDGFAGPGEYRAGESGSPLIALDVAVSHAQKFQAPVKMLFIENRRDCHEHLQALVANWRDRIRESANVSEVVLAHQDCEEELSRILSAYENRRQTLGPALIFLDQFGYSAVSMDLMGRILRHPACEIFCFLNCRDLGRFIEDKGKWSGITSAFGGDEWREVLDLAPAQRSSRLHEIYRESLQAKAKARYFCSFAMHDGSDRLLYWLFFCSGNIRGLEEMKRAMWRVDDSGHFRFSDRYAGQLRLLKGFDQGWLAENLLATLRGQRMRIRQVWEFVLTETPCHKYIDALGILENRGDLLVEGAPPSRRRGTFGKYRDDPRVWVRFLGGSKG